MIFAELLRHLKEPNIRVKTYEVFEKLGVNKWVIQNLATQDGLQVDRSRPDRIEYRWEEEVLDRGVMSRVCRLIVTVLEYDNLQIEFSSGGLLEKIEDVYKTKKVEEPALVSYTDLSVTERLDFALSQIGKVNYYLK